MKAQCLNFGPSLPERIFPLISNFKQADDRTLVQNVLGETAQPPLVDALCCVFRSFVEVNVRNQ
jgi:hypothetical protein